MAIVVNPSGNGYWVALAAGSVWAFGDATIFAGVQPGPDPRGP